MVQMETLTTKHWKEVGQQTFRLTHGWCLALSVYED